MTMQQMPQLQEEQVAGIGKLGRSLKIRPTSGTETGRVVCDLEFIHEIGHIDEAALLEGAIPGATEAYRASVGEGSDGKRPYEWKPAKPDYRLLLCPSPGGKVLYEAAVELRRAALRTSEKSCVLTLYIRLIDLEPEQAQDLIEQMNQAIEYTLTASRLEGATSEDKGALFEQREQSGSQAQGAQVEEQTPVAGQEVLSCKPGDIVTAQLEGADQIEDLCGLVHSVSGGRVLLHESIDGDRPHDIAQSAILSVVPICGPKGGPAKAALKDLSDSFLKEEFQPDAIFLMRALLLEAEEGGISQRTEGWPITREVMTRALDLASESTFGETV